MTQITKVYLDSSGDRQVIASGGSLVLQSGSNITVGGDFRTTFGNGTAAGTGVTAVECMPIIHQTILTLAASSVTMTDAGAAGCHGGLKIYDFPEGVVHIYGATCDLAVTAGAGGITDTASVVGSIGTVVTATDNATLTTTEANIIPSTAVTLTGGVGAFDSASTGGATYNGYSTPVDLFLNFAVPDAGSTANDTLTVSGNVTVTWVYLGDF